MKKGSHKKYNLIHICSFCGNPFPCADWKAARCSECSKCQDCGIPIRGKTRFCKKHQGKHQTLKQKEQLKRLHVSIRGDNNPSKRPEVRKKLSESKMGDKNPARIYREKYAAHIRKYCPGKISKIEKYFGLVVPNLQRQFEVGPYKVDFADADQKLAVEVQGCWFHSCQSCFPSSPNYPIQYYSRNNEIKKKQYLSELGWKIIEIWEHEIRHKTIDEIKVIYESKF